jgi:hypothetical protein
MTTLYKQQTLKMIQSHPFWFACYCHLHVSYSYIFQENINFIRFKALGKCGFTGLYVLLINMMFKTWSAECELRQPYVILKLPMYYHTSQRIKFMTQKVIVWKLLPIRPPLPRLTISISKTSNISIVFVFLNKATSPFASSA